MPLTPHEITKPGLYLEHGPSDEGTLLVNITAISPKNLTIHDLKNSDSFTYSHFSIKDYCYEFIGPIQSTYKARRLYPEYFL